MTRDQALDDIITMYKDYNQPYGKRSVLTRPMEMNLFYLTRIFATIEVLLENPTFVDFTDEELKGVKE